ncbi:MAG TPA: HEAT repeat domain-containing protein, partial [Planctomycetota bacterium]|nr:HEAT repeat domain-containing protein [Planctomycetota bacterium]
RKRGVSVVARARLSTLAPWAGESALAKRTIAEEEKLVRRMAKNRLVAGLGEILIDPDLRAAMVPEVLLGLVDAGTPEAIDALTKAILAPLPTARVEQIFETLLSEPAPIGCRIADAALGHPDPFARWAVVKYLSATQHTHATALLLRASRDPKASVARTAARALLERVEADPGSLSRIRAATAEGIIELLDANWAMEFMAETYPQHLRMVAARRLGQLGGEDATVVLISMVEIAEGDLLETCWKALENMGGVTSHHFIPLLASSSAEVRERALSVYSRWCDEHAEGLLAGFAQDPDHRVRKVALSALVRILEWDASRYLLTGIKDENEHLRLHAVELLAKFPDMAMEMMEVVEQNKGEIRRVGITYLANQGIATPDLVMVYMEFLLRGSSLTDLSDTGYLDGLAAAAKALGHNQVPEALLALTALARSVVRRLRRIAMEAIMLYDCRDRGDALYSLQDTYDPDLLKHVAFGLHESQDPRSFIPMIRTMMEGKGRAVTKAKSILLESREGSDLDTLVPLLQARWASVRRFGAERLKVLKDERSIEPLLTASNDDNVEVQLAVFEALSPFAGSDRRVLDRMLKAIEYGDISIRQAACEALGEARCKEAAPGLIKALHNFFLRPRATEALKRIGDRKGYLALKRIERREAMFPKKPKNGVETSRKHKTKSKSASH